MEEKLFVSYAHVNDEPINEKPITKLVEKFIEYLTGKGMDITYFMDKESIKISNNWKKTIKEGLEKSKLMLAFYSANYFESDSCNEEWTAFEKKTNDGVLPIIPIIWINNFSLPSRLEKYQLYNKDWADGKYAKEGLYPLLQKHPLGPYLDEIIIEIGDIIYQRLAGKRELSNPFKFSSPVFGDKFKDRLSIIKKILRKNAREKIWLMGTRKQGKSSVLRQVEYLINSKGKYSKEYIPFFWDMSGGKKLEDLEDRFELVLAHNNESLSRINISIDEFDNRLNNGEIISILKKISNDALRKHKKIFWLLDEADILVDICQTNPGFIRNLGGLIHADNSRTLITSSRYLVELIESNDPLNLAACFSPPLYLDNFSYDDFEELIKPLKNAKVKDENIADLWKHTSGQPHLVQLLAYFMLEEPTKKFGDIYKKQIKANEDTIMGCFENDFGALSPEEQDIIKHIGTKKSVMLLNIVDSSGSLTKKRTEKLLLRLCNLGFIKEEAENYYINNLIFKEWLDSIIEDDLTTKSKVQLQNVEKTF